MTTSPGPVIAFAEELNEIKDIINASIAKYPSNNWYQYYLGLVNILILKNNITIKTIGKEQIKNIISIFEKAKKLNNEDEEVISMIETNLEDLYCFYINISNNNINKIY